jgi:sporadic carbohydrate cluster 2OG-Fe(II) oxygenase
MSFFRPTEDAIITSFLRDGYAVAPVDARAALDGIRDEVVATTAEFLGLPTPTDPGAFLASIGTHVELAGLNALRLAVIARLMNAAWFRPAYFDCGRTLLETLIGNELAMQRSIGLSVQLPRDDSSILPLHSDAWSEDSPFELVLWIPLVDVRGTMSMFALPKDAAGPWETRMHEFAATGVEAFYAALEPELRWLEVDYGEAIVFTHTLLHGNRINREPAARWSLNVRFKGLFTPYSDKRLGDFFEPITLRPASRIGLDYRLPAGFHE